MRVIYDTCVADPWIKVALKLQMEHGYEPVYWIGYEDDDSKRLIVKAFPGVIYHPYFDACKGIFPPEIECRAGESYISVDFLKSFASQKLQALKMMERMDPDRHSFNFMERQRHFLNLLKYWGACIEFLKPDLIIFGNVPHQAFDYVLYLACMARKIKLVSFRGTAFPGRVVPLTGISSIGDIFDKEYATMLASNADADSLKRELPGDIRRQYEQVRSDYVNAEPLYMKRHACEHQKSSGLFSLTQKFLRDLHSSRDRYFGRNGYLTQGIPTFFKQRGQSIERSRTTVMNYAVMKLKANAYKRSLRKHYSSMATEPDFATPYIVLNLHYQPEMTSSPSGDIFVDQRLCLEVLCRHLPAGTMIYVKEHPAQFYSHLGGHTARIPEFYEDLLRDPRVRLMPLHVDPFILFRHSRAVSTVSGTSGWEAMLMGKPVICFGLTWYERFAGVLKVVDDRSAAQIPRFIETFRFDERNLMAYLHAFSRRSIRAYAHRDWQGKIQQDEAECVANLAGGILRMTAT